MIRSFKIGGITFDLDQFNLSKSEFRSKFAGRLKVDLNEAYKEIQKAKKQK